MVQEISTEDIIIQQRGNVGHVILNRPKALNALNLEMIRGLAYALNDWEEDPSICSVFIEGAGERAFCAGGDIKGFYNAGMDYRRGKLNFDVLMLFFKEEYALNKRLFHYKKPVIAFMDGITMGGGYGIAGNCKFRIATENTVFAMPEVKIGFFPDVGSMYHFSRVQKGMGIYLALTGSSILAADMIYAGLADSVLDTAEKDELISHLEKIDSDDAFSQVQKVVDALGKTFFSQSSFLQKYSDFFEKIYLNSNSSEEFLELLKNLAQTNNDVAKNIAGSEYNSPFSIKITYEYFKRAKTMSFDDIMTQDFILACNFAKGLDFYEGIRAAVIDKDRRPHWIPHKYKHSEIRDFFA